MARFRWDANPQATGFKIYATRVSGDYGAPNALPGSPLDVGNVTVADFPVTQSGDFFFSATAYNAVGESAHSAELRGKFVVTGSLKRGS